MHCQKSDPPAFAWRCATSWVIMTSAWFAVWSASESFAHEVLPTSIEKAARYSRTQNQLGIIIQQSGRTLIREFAPGHSAGEPVRIYSGTKFFWCLAAMIAQKEGLLDLDERVCDTISEWGRSPQKREITIKQLLNFTSGLPPINTLHEDNVLNRDKTAIEAELVAAPGKRFVYGPASMQVFHALLERKLAAKGTSATSYLEQRVLKPLDLGPQRYLSDRSGHPLLAAGFMLAADQWLAAGKLMMRKGRPLLSAAEFSECLSGTEANQAFGLGVWNNTLAQAADAKEIDLQRMLEEGWQKQVWTNVSLCRSAPMDLMASIGSHGQRLYVVPSLQLIVLRQGLKSDFNDAKFLALLFGSD